MKTKREGKMISKKDTKIYKENMSSYLFSKYRLSSFSPSEISLFLQHQQALQSFRSDRVTEGRVGGIMGKKALVM